MTPLGEWVAVPALLSAQAVPNRPPVHRHYRQRCVACGAVISVCACSHVDEATRLEWPEGRCQKCATLQIQAVHRAMLQADAVHGYQSGQPRPTPPPAVGDPGDCHHTIWAALPMTAEGMRLVHVAEAAHLTIHRAHQILHSLMVRGLVWQVDVGRYARAPDREYYPPRTNGRRSWCPADAPHEPTE